MAGEGDQPLASGPLQVAQAGEEPEGARQQLLVAPLAAQEEADQAEPRGVFRRGLEPLEDRPPERGDAVQGQALRPAQGVEQALGPARRLVAHQADRPAGEQRREELLERGVEGERGDEREAVDAGERPGEGPGQVGGQAAMGDLCPLGPAARARGVEEVGGEARVDLPETAPGPPGRRAGRGLSGIGGVGGVGGRGIGLPVERDGERPALRQGVAQVAPQQDHPHPRVGDGVRQVGPRIGRVERQIGGAGGEDAEDRLGELRRTVEAEADDVARRDP